MHYRLPHSKVNQRRLLLLLLILLLHLLFKVHFAVTVAVLVTFLKTKDSKEKIAQGDSISPQQSKEEEEEEEGRCRRWAIRILRPLV